MKTHTGSMDIARHQEQLLLHRLLVSFLMAFGLLMMPVAMDVFTGLDAGSIAQAQGNGPGNGPGGGGDGEGSGGKKGPGGNNGVGGGAGKPPANKGGLYGDAVYILRDADGVPILYTFEGDAEVDAFSCVQPLAIGSYDGGDWTLEDATTLPLVGYPPNSDPDLTTEMETFCVDNTLVEAQYRVRLAAAEADEDPDSVDYCDVIPKCADNATEVEQGRLSVLRAPDRVLDRQRDEAIRTIDKYYPDVRLDHGGRLVVNGSTFDSPLINLALMREFMNWGELAGDPGLIWRPPEWLDEQYTPLMAAAFGLAAGDDKLGAPLDPEVVVRNYLTADIPTNTDYMTLIDTAEMFDPSGLLREYLDFEGFSYDRTTTFTGWICWDELNEAGTAYERFHEPILEKIFGNAPYAGDGLAAFAVAAEDARQVLLFVHDENVIDVHAVYEGVADRALYCPDL